MSKSHLYPEFVIPFVNPYSIIFQYQQYLNRDVSLSNKSNEESEIVNNLNENDPTKSLSHEIAINSKDNTLSYYNNDKHIQMILSDKNQLIPTEVNIQCWWCRNFPISKPILLPIQYTPSTKKYLSSYKGEGYFDHPSCMLAYYKKVCKGKKEYKNIEGCIDTFLRDLYGSNTKILPAPDWKLLDICGGPWSRKKYNEERGKCAYKKLSGHNKHVPVNTQLAADIKCPDCDKTIISCDNLVTLIPVGTWYIKKD